MRRLLCSKRPSDACKFLPSPCFDGASVKIKDPNVYSVQTGPKNQKTPPRPGTGSSVYVPITSGVMSANGLSRDQRLFFPAILFKNGCPMMWTKGPSLPVQFFCKGPGL